MPQIRGSESSERFYLARSETTGLDLELLD